MKNNDIGREELWLFSAVVKWGCLAMITGVIVGIAASVFINTLHEACDFVARLGKYKLLAIFPGFFVSYMLVRVYSRDAKVNVVSAIHNDFGTVDLRAIPLRLLSTIATISCGGATGKESPCASIGAGAMYAFSKLLDFDDTDKRKLVTIGSAAGISAVFGTPIAGAIFGVEILYMGELHYEVLFSSLISGVISSLMAGYFNAGGLPMIAIPIPQLAPRFLFESLLCGIVFGVVAMLHVELLERTRNGFLTLRVPHKAKPFIGAAAVALITFLFGDFYGGLNNQLTTAALFGARVPDAAFALKSIALALTLGCGGSGGVIMPTMFVGATAGSCLAFYLGFNMQAASALGFVALLAGATNTPVACTILAMELFGSQIAPFAGIACFAAYMIAGHRSLYTGQLILQPKTDMFVSKKDARGRPQITQRFETIPYSRIIKFKYNKTKKNLRLGRKKKNEKFRKDN